MKLYQQMILDHSRSPKGFTDNPQGCCESAYNPLCGDKVKACVEIEGDKIVSITFHAEGCSLSLASASLLVDVVKGMTVSEFLALQAEFLKVFKGEDVELPRKLEALKGVLQYPMRVKCVTMVWHAVKQAIERANYPVELTERCIDYWASLVEAQEGKGILLEFKQLGCFGWQFTPSVQTEVLEDKLAFNYGQFVLWIDEALVPKVKGTKVDCIQDSLGQTQVVFQHPKAKQHCGCGESFVIEDSDG